MVKQFFDEFPKINSFASDITSPPPTHDDVVMFVLRTAYADLRHALNQFNNTVTEWNYPINNIPTIWVLFYYPPYEYRVHVSLRGDYVHLVRWNTQTAESVKDLGVWLFELFDKELPMRVAPAIAGRLQRIAAFYRKRAERVNKEMRRVWSQRSRWLDEILSRLAYEGLNKTGVDAETPEELATAAKYLVMVTVATIRDALRALDDNPQPATLNVRCGDKVVNLWDAFYDGCEEMLLKWCRPFTPKKVARLLRWLDGVTQRLYYLAAR